MARALFSTRRYALFAACCVLLAACGDGVDVQQTGASPSRAVTNPALANASATNSPPRLSGAPPTTAKVGQAYHFAPSASDADNDPLTFSVEHLPSWAVFSTSTGEIDGTAVLGTFENIVINVSDGQDRVSLAPFTIAVADTLTTNSPPVINGSPPTAVTAGQLYSFAPEGSDPDGDPLTFSVTNPPPWATFSQGTGELLGTPSAADVGTFAGIVIRVSDGREEASLPPLTVIVASVGGSNATPVISGSPPGTVTVGQIYTFTPNASDADGNPLVFAVANLPSWANFNPASGRIDGTPTAGHVGAYGNIAISVSDGRASASLAAFKITVVPAPGSNSLPTISGTPTATVTAGDAYSFTPNALDADGDSLTFTVSNLPGWAAFSSSSGRISGTPSAAHVGTYTGILIRVSDGQANATLAPFSITVRMNNRAPVISGAPATFATQGHAYSFAPSASDPDGNPLTFGISGRPAWAAFDSSTGRLTGTPSLANIGSYGNIVITVSDGQVSSSLAAFSITVQATNRAPSISGTPTTTVTSGQSYSFTPAASDLDGDALTFAIQGRPSWATFDASTGRLSGTPSVANAGAFGNIVITVSDGQATASLAAFGITVQRANQSPTISGAPATTVTLGQSYSFTPTATDPDGNPLTFAILNRPSWATFNANTGRLNGTPAAANVGSSANIVISVSDGQVSVPLAAFSITVQSTNRAPVISGSPPTNVTFGQAYSFTPTASDPDGNSLTFSIAGRPAWATFSSTTGRLEGTPSAANVGAYSGITISVSDGQTSSSLAQFSIAVQAANRAPVISGTPLTTILAGQSYSFTPTGSDPDGDALAFAVTNLPSWASFNTSTGRISGTPGSAQVGTYNNITISVSDGRTSSPLQSFAITVTAVTNGSATLMWTPPTRNTDGSTLQNLAGYRIYWGTSQSNLSNSTTVNNPGLSSYVVEQLSPATWYFAVSAVNAQGVESARSNFASKTIP